MPLAGNMLGGRLRTFRPRQKQGGFSTFTSRRSVAVKGADDAVQPSSSCRQPQQQNAATAATSALSAFQQQVQQPQLPSMLSAVGCSAEQLAVVAGEQLAGQGQVLISGVEPDMYAALRKALPGVQYHARARMLLVKSSSRCEGASSRRLPGSVAVLFGGPADQPAAEQVKLAGEHLGCYVVVKGGLSSTNLARLLQQLPGLAVADVLVVVAGSDLALPTVLSGLVTQPIIALPSSAGAAAVSGQAPAAAGLSALMAGNNSTMLGVTCVGLDAATSAAAAAARMLTATARRMQLLAQAAAPALAAAPTPVAEQEVAATITAAAVRQLEQQYAADPLDLLEHQMMHGSMAAAGT